MMRDIYTEFEKRQSLGESMKNSSVEFATNFFVQLNYISRRVVTNLIRDPAAALMQTIIMSFVAVIIGAIYFNVPDEKEKGLINRFEFK